MINKTILTALKKKLEMAKRKWVDELLGVLWAYQTTPGWPTKTTSYALTYGMEVVIPIEIGMSTTKTIIQGQMDENHELGEHLDWVDEVRGNAAIRMASYRQRAIAHYNKKARPRMF